MHDVDVGADVDIDVQGAEDEEQERVRLALEQEVEMAKRRLAAFNSRSMGNMRDKQVVRRDRALSDSR